MGLMVRASSLLYKGCLLVEKGPEDIRQMGLQLIIKHQTWNEGKDLNYPRQSLMSSLRCLIRNGLVPMGVCSEERLRWIQTLMTSGSGFLPPPTIKVGLSPWDILPLWIPGWQLGQGKVKGPLVAQLEEVSDDMLINDYLGVQLEVCDGIKFALSDTGKDMLAGLLITCWSALNRLDIA